MDKPGGMEGFEEKLAALTRAFNERLELRHRELAAAAAELQAAADEDAKAAALEQVRKLAHGISGSAATFGHPALTRLAQALEATCLTAIDKGAGRGAMRTVTGRLAKLIAAVAAARPD